MAKRGPGKFSDDLDAAIYSLTLDGGADEEASYGEGNGWYGLMRDGGELADAIEDEDVDAAELEFLRTEGQAGVILFERSDGGVEAAYYKSKAALDKDWAEVEADTAQGDEEFEENARRSIEGRSYAVTRDLAAHRDRLVAQLRRRELDDAARNRLEVDLDETRARLKMRRRRNGEEDILRDETIEPYLKGKGPVFRIQTWETVKRDPDRFRGGRPMLGYRITMTEPGGQPEVVYEGEDYSPSPMIELDSDRTIDDIVAFFTDYDDEDDEGVSRRTARQKEVVREHGDTLSGEVSAMYGEDREENSRRANGSQPWVVTLNGEQTDIVYYDDQMDADEVRRSLIDHDGYDPRIKVKKRERRRTHAPDALAQNRRKRARA